MKEGMQSAGLSCPVLSCPVAVPRCVFRSTWTLLNANHLASRIHLQPGVRLTFKHVLYMNIISNSVRLLPRVHMNACTCVAHKQPAACDARLPWSHSCAGRPLSLGHCQLQLVQRRDALRVSIHRSRPAVRAADAAAPPLCTRVRVRAYAPALSQEGLYQEIVDGSPGSTILYHESLTRRLVCPPLKTGAANLKGHTRPPLAAFGGLSNRTANDVRLVDEPYCYNSTQYIPLQCDAPYVWMVDSGGVVGLSDLKRGGYDTLYINNRYVCSQQVRACVC